MNNISGTNWGFTGGDVWSQGMMIVVSLASFVLLGLVIRMAPLMISVVSAALHSKKYHGTYDWKDNFESERNRAEKIRSGWYDRDDY